jgi:hypothetical protein
MAKHPGMNPMIAACIAEAPYPRRRSKRVAADPIVNPQDAARIVEAFLDQGTITYSTMLALIWGERRNPLTGEMVPDEPPGEPGRTT